MKITLNLLPKKRRKKIENRKILKLFIWQEGMLIFAVIILLGVMVGVNEVVKIRLKSLGDQIAINSQKGNYAEIKKYEDALDEVKSDMIVIDKVQKNNINWIPIFKEINDIIPDGIVINSISNEEYKIIMMGTADSRDQLINMKSEMENTQCFEEIAVPINDIVLKNDIDFKLDFKVNKDCLIEYE